MSSKNYLKSILIPLILLALISFQGIHGWAQEKQKPRKQPLPEISSKVYNKISPTTVKILCNQGEKIGTGAIVAITKKGEAIIMTACHVVTSNWIDAADPDIQLEFYQDIQVKFVSELKPVDAAVIAKFVDRENDLALIVTKTPVGEESVISYANSDKVKPGEIVAAAGFPATDELNLTVGRITRREKYIIFDAKIAEGCSGGPLIDKKGRMIGLSTHIIESYIEDEGYATPINLITTVVDSWLNNLKLKTKWQLENDKSFFKSPLFISSAVVSTGAILYLSGAFSGNGKEGEFPMPVGRPQK
jgi:S1-C subfamily serine protease